MFTTIDVMKYSILHWMKRNKMRFFCLKEDEKNYFALQIVL